MDNVVEVESVNDKFYTAFESWSIEKMEEVWSHGDNTICGDLGGIFSQNG